MLLSGDLCRFWFCTDEPVLVQQYWSRLEAWQFVPVKAFASAFAKSQLGQRNAAELEAPLEHAPKEGELDPLQRDKCVP